MTLCTKIASWAHCAPGFPIPPKIFEGALLSAIKIWEDLICQSVLTWSNFKDSISVLYSFWYNKTSR